MGGALVALVALVGGGTVVVALVAGPALVARGMGLSSFLRAVKTLSRHYYRQQPGKLGLPKLESPNVEAGRDELLAA